MFALVSPRAELGNPARALGAAETKGPDRTPDGATSVELGSEAGRAGSADETTRALAGATTGLVVTSDAAADPARAVGSNSRPPLEPTNKPILATIKVAAAINA